jgi:hypothetical protein
MGRKNDIEGSYRRGEIGTEKGEGKNKEII